MSAVVIVLSFIFAAAIVVIVAAVKNIHVCAPNEVMIFAGRTFRTEGGRVVGFRVVRGGRAIRIPIIETMSRMSLNNIPIHLSVQGAYSRGGVPLDVVAVANIKLPSQEPLLHNALERFAGRSNKDITNVATDTLEGCLRGVIAELTPEEINQQKKLFEKKLNDEAHKDMHRLGLVLDNLQIQNIADQVGYLTSVGLVRGAEVRKEARIGEVRAQAQAAVQKAENARASEVAKLESQMQILREENRRRIIEAQTTREALIAEARGEVSAEVVEARAQVKNWEARAERVRRQLDADVIVPASAKKAQLEASAKAWASQILADGRARAEALRQQAQAYAAGGSSASDAILAQKLVPVFAQLLTTMHDMKVERLAVMAPSTNGLVTLTEQIRAAIGVDLTRALPEAVSSPIPNRPPSAPSG